MFTTIFTVPYEAYLPNAIDRGTALQFSENQTATVCLFGRFYLLRVSASKGRINLGFWETAHPPLS